MSTVLYPKGSKQPSSGVGEQKPGVWSEGNKTEYGNTSVKGYNGEGVKTITATGGTGSPCKSDYPKSGQTSKVSP